MYRGDVFLGNVCISFSGDLKLHANTKMRRTYAGTRVMYTSENL